MMIQRRSKTAGLRTKISAHSFRATGITTYLKNGGKLEVAQAMAGHESARTTGLGSKEWLQYKNSNGDNFEAKIHCNTLSHNDSGPVIRAWAETKHNGRTEGDRKGILITDGSAPGWTVEFMQHTGNDKPVTFTLPHSILQGY